MMRIYERRDLARVLAHAGIVIQPEAAEGTFLTDVAQQRIVSAPVLGHVAKRLMPMAPFPGY